MSRGLTNAELVQQVLYAVYKVRLDVDESLDGSFHCKSDKFKEVLMEANFVLQELQKEADWNFLRERWVIGKAHNPSNGGIQEITIPEHIYKLCTGFGDAVRLHSHHDSLAIEQIPFESARTVNRRHIDMFNDYGQLNTDNGYQRASVIGNTLTFNRPWFPYEEGLILETDAIRYIEPLHICDNNCPDHCPQAYEERNLTWLSDPYWLVVRTAAKRAEADPSTTDRVQSLSDEANKIMSAIRENDSAKTTTDFYETSTLGYISVL